MTKDELLLKRLKKCLELDLRLIAEGRVTYDILGTLRVNRDVAANRFPQQLEDLINAATEALTKHRR